MSPNDLWFQLSLSAALVFMGGIFAGLTLGLMGLDEIHLKVIIASSDNEVERANARRVLALLNKGRHWVLVVLLLSNVVINESLPIFLDNAIGGGFAAIALSTAAIVIFGFVLFFLPVLDTNFFTETLSVRYGLAIGAAFAPLVLVLMYIFAPIAYPIACLLDYILGVDDSHQYQKAQLKSFLQLHSASLCAGEIGILEGALDLGSKSVKSLMTPMQDVMTLASDAILDDRLMETILQSGYSRFPVYIPGEPRRFIGLLLIKKLLRYDPAQALPVSAFPLSILPEAPPHIDCFQALDYFETGRAHLLLISSTPGMPGGEMGILTLEDIIEEILAHEIVDETDWYEDNVTRQPAKRVTTATIMRGCVPRHPSCYHLVHALVTKAQQDCRISSKHRESDTNANSHSRNYRRTHASASRSADTVVT
ncbi:hypothetical protein HMN09_00444500 [Mycena chlorophos]|uniref:DUF21-domain-containing protein n=1 Tax=Mycena chlorophos TaxID=658473 RepID=A0A8H6TEE3_MYCCL|nr:hypothetical protein HMN09_00444500 [Mycena chlorophos]